MPPTILSIFGVKPTFRLQDHCPDFPIAEQTIKQLIQFYNPFLSKSFGIHLKRHNPTDNDVNYRFDHSKNFLAVHKWKQGNFEPETDTKATKNPVFVTEKVACDTVNFMKMIDSQREHGLLPLSKPPKSGKSLNIIHCFIGCSILNAIRHFNDDPFCYMPIAILTSRNEGEEQFLRDDSLLGLLRYIDICSGNKTYPLYNYGPKIWDEVSSILDWPRHSFQSNLGGHGFFVKRIKGCVEKLKPIIDLCLQPNVSPVFLSDEFDEGSNSLQLTDKILSTIFDGDTVYKIVKNNRAIFVPVSATNELAKITFPEYALDLSEEDCYTPIDDVPRHRISSLPIIPELKKHLRLAFHTTTAYCWHPLSSEENFVKAKCGKNMRMFGSFMEWREFVEKFPHVVANLCQEIDKKHVDSKGHWLITIRSIVKNDEVIRLAESLRKIWGEDAAVIPYCGQKDRQYDTHWMKYKGAEPAITAFYKMKGWEPHSRMTVMLIANSERRTDELPDRTAMVFCGNHQTTQVALEQELCRAAGNNRSNTAIYLSDKQMRSLDCHLKGTPIQKYSLQSKGKKGRQIESKSNFDLYTENVDSIQNENDRNIIKKWVDDIERVVFNQPYQLALIKNAWLRNREDKDKSKYLNQVIVGGGGWYKHCPGVDVESLFPSEVFDAFERNATVLEGKSSKLQVRLLRFRNSTGVPDINKGRLYDHTIGIDNETFPGKEDKYYPFLGIRSKEMNQGGIRSENEENSNVAPHKQNGTMIYVRPQLWYEFNRKTKRMNFIRCTLRCNDGSFMEKSDGITPKQNCVVDKFVQEIRVEEKQ